MDSTLEKHDQYFATAMDVRKSFNNLWISRGFLPVVVLKLFLVEPVVLRPGGGPVTKPFCLDAEDPHASCI